MQRLTVRVMPRLATRRNRLQDSAPAVWLAASVLLLLTACTTPLSVAPGTPAAQVRARFGRPDGEYRLTGQVEGSRFEYDTGPAGQRTYMVDFGPDGRAVRAWQPLTRDHFAQIRPGIDTIDSVRREFGNPRQIRPSFRFGDGYIVWEYPYLEVEVWNSLMTLTFTPKGIVQSVENGQDPRLIVNR